MNHPILGLVDDDGSGIASVVALVLMSLIGVGVLILFILIIIRSMKRAAAPNLRQHDDPPAKGQ